MRTIWLVIFVVVLAGCATVPPTVLVEAGDSRIHVALDTVIVRGAKESWAHDAYWDEYRLRVRSMSGAELHVSRIRVFDAFERPVDASADIKELIRASKEIERDYLERGTLISPTKDHLNVGWFPIVRHPFTIALFPVAIVAEIAVGDPIRRAIQDGSLKRRQTPLPARIGEADAALAAFFPVVPRPSALEVSYWDDDGEHRITLLTETALDTLHEANRQPKPLFPTR